MPQQREVARLEAVQTLSKALIGEREPEAALDRVAVAGKTEPVVVHELLDVDPGARCAAKLCTAERFAEGLAEPIAQRPLQAPLRSERQAETREVLPRELPEVAELDLVLDKRLAVHTERVCLEPALDRTPSRSSRRLASCRRGMVLQLPCAQRRVRRGGPRFYAAARFTMGKAALLDVTSRPGSTTRVSATGPRGHPAIGRGLARGALCQPQPSVRRHPSDGGGLER